MNKPTKLTINMPFIMHEIIMKRINQDRLVFVRHDTMKSETHYYVYYEMIDMWQQGERQNMVKSGELKPERAGR